MAARYTRRARESKHPYLGCFSLRSRSLLIQRDGASSMEYPVQDSFFEILGRTLIVGTDPKRPQQHEWHWLDYYAFVSNLDRLPLHHAALITTHPSSVSLLDTFRSERRVESRRAGCH